MLNPFHVCIDPEASHTGRGERGEGRGEKRKGAGDAILISRRRKPPSSSSLFLWLQGKGREWGRPLPCEIWKKEGERERAAAKAKASNANASSSSSEYT